ncbi:MAG TPA: ATP-dependent protease ATPase subunit HslU [Candidatus Hydrogenedentes bacterium]|nr:ATP-dependent protease ATPase subunit HslU [Candidatus Hydrogenedentota bacterium]
MDNLDQTVETSAGALTPRQIVEELNRYIIGQHAAKRKVAIALRNRWRRQQLPPEIREEVIPKNILMIGPTGVGKTEIARRLARLVDAPFIKVEASKFTEVGYVGRDCESMVRELVDSAYKMVRAQAEREMDARADAIAEERLIDLLLGGQPERLRPPAFHPLNPMSGDEGPARNVADAEDSRQRAREILRRKLAAGEFDDREVELTVSESPAEVMMGVFNASGMEEIGMNMQEVLSRIAPRRARNRRVKVREARKILKEQAFEELIDRDFLARQAVERAEEEGIIFLDEIDKIAGRGAPGHGPDVSREGVQRDILPIVEGSVVMTKYGSVRTDHILFIAAGAFHVAKVSDLIPELQGRFPIRVELESLRADDFEKILRETDNSLLSQYRQMLATEGVTLEFDDEAVRLIARYCERFNAESEDIGARRLHTILEHLLEDISFAGPERAGETIRVTAEMVRDRLEGFAAPQDLTRYIL